jgi:hypothetical protein
MMKDSAREQHQKALTDFLRIDSDLAFTFLQTAAIESDVNPDHSRTAIEKARAALLSIYQLAARVEDPVVRAEIESRANKLESAIKTVAPLAAARPTPVSTSTL